MRKYDRDDIVVLYIITFDDGRNNSVQAWTDDKEMAKSYLEFHSSHRMKMRVIKKRLRDLMDVINQNRNDEISICNLTTHNHENHKKGHESIIIQVPMTITEMSIVNDDANTFMGSRIKYSKLEEYLPYLKTKYQRALSAIFLDQVIAKVMHEANTKFTNNVLLDDLIVLYRNYAEYFD